MWNIESNTTPIQEKQAMATTATPGKPGWFSGLPKIVQQALTVAVTLAIAWVSAYFGIAPTTQSEREAAKAVIEAKDAKAIASEAMMIVNDVRFATFIKAKHAKAE